MELIIDACLEFEHKAIYSSFLERIIHVDFFAPTHVANAAEMSLLLINDGQDMAQMNFGGMLNRMYYEDKLQPVLCVAISANEDRKMEYGVAAETDYLGRGAKAGAYANFILNELLPLVHQKYNIPKFREIGFAGFSLGGLSALDIVWNHPEIFTKAGIFSGSLWWRNKGHEENDYHDHEHRIMQKHIREGKLASHQQFFFQCGALDETNDRNNNGIVDAIDDTLDTIHEIINKGYSFKNIHYLEIDDGSHDVHTWGRAMPVFLEWGWGVKAVSNKQNK